MDATQTEAKKTSTNDLDAIELVLPKYRPRGERPFRTREQDRKHFAAKIRREYGMSK